MNYNYSKVSKRFIAMCVDYLILILLIFMENTFLYNIVSNFAMNVIAVIIVIMYFVYFESSKKQATIGKQAMSIIVTDIDGKRLTILKAMSRTIIKYIVSIIFLFIKFLPFLNSCYGIIIRLAAMFTPKKQTLYDLIVGSIVIDKNTN